LKRACEHAGWRPRAVGYVGKRLVGMDVLPGIDVLPDRTIERLLQ
jgi:hypothetical protein